MSSEGPDAAAAGPEPRLGFENGPSLIDTVSNQEGHAQQPVAQSHKRSLSSSSSIFDTSDNGQGSHDLSDEIGAMNQPTARSGRDERKLKGKATNNVELGETYEAGSSEETVVYQARDLPEGVHVGGQFSGSETPTSQLTRRERVKQPLPGGDYHSRYYHVPDTEANTNSSGDPAESKSTSTAVSRPPPTGLPSFGAQGNTEEDRRNWERIQAIGGDPVQSNYHPRQALPDPAVALESTRPSQKRKSRSSEDPRSLDGTGLNVFAAQPGHLRLSVDDRSSSSSDGSTPLLPHTSLSQTSQRQDRRLRPEVVVPRWQPDAEVTLCPICGTQFSFFVRKHHCRKCGRVVCNACSPHRITIPYQFIVQPPTESDTLNVPNSRARPALDPARAGSSSEFENLGGGERVRLCNPCVPDPNTAPPQTPSPSFRNQQHSSPRSTHSRSSSSAATYASSQGNLSSSTPSERPGAEHLNWRIRREFPQQRSILRQQPSNSPPHARGQPYSVFHNQSTTNSNVSSDQAQRDSRIRASTVSHGAVRPDQNAQRATVPGMPAGLPRVLPSSRAQADLRPLVPRTEHQSRPLPRTPRPQRIAEEDECPICHQELPSSQLPDSEALRAAHITNCIETAMQGTTSPPSPSPPPQTIATPSFVPSTVRGSNAPSSSSAVPPVPVPIANTPEARMAAREQAHAAIVLGQHSSPSPAFRRTGVFPYKATEKDCVDDAECTICLEEFEVGQDMGRLECFCRFHLHCIREWFVNHYGQCPVHHQAY